MISRQSELGKLLIDRRPGAMLEIEIISRGETQPRRVILVAGQSWYNPRRE